MRKRAMVSTVHRGGGLAAAGGSPGGVWGVLRATYAGPAWTSTAFTALTAVLAVPAFLTVLILTVVGVPLLLVALAGVPLIWAGLLTARLSTRVDAWRFETMLGWQLPLRPTPTRGPDGRYGRFGRFGGELRRLSVGGSWLNVVYTLVVAPVFGWLGGWLLFVAWGGGLAFLLFPAYGFTLSAGERIFGRDLGYGGSVALHVGLGVAALLAAPWLARGLAFAHHRVARWLLSPRGEELLAQRVEDLESSRAGMVAAAAAERRRIERDLHDGAQQRLVAVAMTLGRAQTRFERDPDGAAGLVAEAHAETKRALAELRDLARGIHPSVLTDRGLDAALSGLAARCPVPVTVDVDDGQGRDQDADAVAYFFVAEALTNIARHATATRARIVVRRGGGRLVVEVADDGRGGAREDRGSGLAGLRDRARAVDGTFTLSSPAGLGTTLRLEMPCAS
ncbi:sensor histidine kinase [Frankia canadensis]|uniref:sensor histidine kinase n=1 Tax=Frankia canadensis TaxID=1836972 RepID=UPI001FB00F52|nr:histidine kinase [Frankia canadensis]